MCQATPRLLLPGPKRFGRGVISFFEVDCGGGRRPVQQKRTAVGLP
jgi:hypothetical protein